MNFVFRALSIGSVILASSCSTGPRTITDSTCGEKIDRILAEKNRGQPITGGEGLKPEEIDSRVRAKEAEFRACVKGAEAPTDRQPREIRVAALLSPDGTVEISCIEASQFSNDKTDECIEGVLKSIRFPAPRGGRAVGFHYPILFRPK